MEVFKDMVHKLEAGSNSQDGADQGFLVSYFLDLLDQPMFHPPLNGSKLNGRLPLGSQAPLEHLVWIKQCDYLSWRSLAETLVLVVMACPATRPKVASTMTSNYRATDRTSISLVVMAVVFAFVPVEYLILLAFYEAYTREMPLRKESSDQWPRRMREWWYIIPAAPVQLIKPDDKK